MSGTPAPDPDLLDACRAAREWLAEAYTEHMKGYVRGGQASVMREHSRRRRVAAIATAGESITDPADLPPRQRGQMVWGSKSRTASDALRCAEQCAAAGEPCAAEHLEAFTSAARHLVPDEPEPLPEAVRRRGLYVAGFGPDGPLYAPRIRIRRGH